MVNKIRLRGGSPADVLTQVKTRTINNNGFNPVWDEEFRFSISAPGHFHPVFSA